MTADTDGLALQVRHLSKTFARVRALSDFDLDVGVGEVVALVGENGSGKSTLIKILSGYHEPDSGGTVHIVGNQLTTGSAESSYRLGCRFVHQDLGLIPNLSVLDNMALGAGYSCRRLGTISWRKTRSNISADLQRLSLTLDLDAKISELTPARRASIAIARALRSDPHGKAQLLVLDEPTATLAAGEVEQLLDLIRTIAATGVGVLYVTHHLDEAFRVADRGAILRDGRLVAVRKISELDHQTVVSLMVGRELDEIHDAATRLTRLTDAPTLEVAELCADNIQGVSFSAYPGEILGIAGITGSGRETLLGAVFGGTRRESGSVRVSGTLIPSERPDCAMASGMAFLPPDRKTLGAVMDLSAKENLTLGSVGSFRTLGGRISSRREKAESDRWFRRLDIRPADAVDSPLSIFSGGNQQKVLFAKWLRRGPVVFLLDGPCEGVDVGARTTLHKQLVEAAAEGLTVIVASTDVDELVALCSRVLVLRGGVIAAELSGDQIRAATVTKRMLSGVDEQITSTEGLVGS